MGIQATNVRSRGRNRRNLPVNSMAMPVNATVGTVAAAGLNLTVDFNMPVVLNGVPQYLTAGVNGGLPVSAVMLTAQQLRLTYAAAQDASTQVDVPQNDPGVRTTQGGFVNAGTFTL